MTCPKGNSRDTARGVFITVDDTPVPGYTVSINDLVATFTNTSKGTRLTYLWDFGDGETSTDENPIHTYQAGGKYTISLKATNSCGAFTKVSEIKLQGVGTFASNEASTEMDVTPNPANNSFNITLKGLEGEQGTIRVFSVNQTPVFEQKILSNSPKEAIQVKCDTWASGIYLVVYKSAKYVTIKRVIVR